MDNQELKTARRTEAGCLGFALFLLILAMALCLVSVNGSRLCFFGGLILLFVGAVSLIPCFDLSRDVRELERKASSEDRDTERKRQSIKQERLVETFDETKLTTIAMSNPAAVNEAAQNIQQVVEAEGSKEPPVFIPRPATAEQIEVKLRQLEEKIRGN